MSQSASSIRRHLAQTGRGLGFLVVMPIVGALVGITVSWIPELLTGDGGALNALASIPLSALASGYLTRRLLAAREPRIRKRWVITSAVATVLLTTLLVLPFLVLYWR